MSGGVLAAAVWNPEEVLILNDGSGSRLWLNTPFKCVVSTIQLVYSWLQQPHVIENEAEPHSCRCTFMSPDDISYLPQLLQETTK